VSLALALVADKKSQIIKKATPKWSRFGKLLSKAGIGEKDGYGWLPAIIDIGPRKSDRIGGITALVLDIEACKKTPEVQPPKPKKIMAKILSSGLSCILHTSYTHTPKKPRYRLIFPLSRILHPNELKGVGTKIVQELGLNLTYDKGALEPARLYYLPRCAAENVDFFEYHTVKAKPIDVDSYIQRGQLPFSENLAAANVLNFPDLMEDTRILAGYTSCKETSSSLKEMFSFLSADSEYDRWRVLIWSALSTGLPDAEDIARDWSKTAPDRYSEAALGLVVKSYDPSKNITIGTLIHHAKKAGWKPKIPEEITPPETIENNRFSFIPASELCNLPPLVWRVKNLLPDQGLGAIFGPSGSGKSFYVLDLLAHLVFGKEFWGHKVNSCPVVYVALEGTGGIGKRIQAWEKHNGKTLPDSFRVVTDSLSLRNKDSMVFAQAVLDAKLTEGVIVIDTLAASAPGADENASHDMSTIIGNSQLLQRITNSLVLLVHHTGKDAQRGLRGHSSLHAALDVAIEVKSNKQGREWAVAKLKDGDYGVTHSFNLEQVELGIDDDGDVINSCVVTPDLFRKDLPAEPRGKNQKLVLNALSCSVEAGQTISASETIDCGMKALVDVDGKHRRHRAKKAIESLVENGNLIQTDGGCEVV
jgi:hypothetical protein